MKIPETERRAAHLVSREPSALKQVLLERLLIDLAHRIARDAIRHDLQDGWKLVRGHATAKISQLGESQLFGALREADDRHDLLSPSVILHADDRNLTDRRVLEDLALD